MATGDIYKCNLKQAIEGQAMENVFHFQQISGEGNAAAVAAMIESIIVPLVADIQSGDLTHTGVTVLNIGDIGDFADVTYVTPIPGDRSGDRMPSFNAYAFRKTRNSSKMRHGSFRLAGAIEADITDGEANANVTGALTALATALSSSIEDGAGNSYLFGYIGHILGNPMPMEVFGTGVSYIRFSTQNSRKPWQ